METTETIEQNTNQAATVYDADAVQKIPVGDGVYAVVTPFTDEMFLQNRREFAEKVNEFIKRGDEREMSEIEIREALIKDCELADKLIENLENYPDLPADWKELMSAEDKQAIIRKATTFVIDEERDLISLGKTIVPTAAYFNGEVTNQTHILRRRTIDDSSAFTHITSKQYKPLKNKKFGQKTGAEFVPQDAAKAALYDAMLESVSGFAGNKVSLRVKVLVIDHIFTPVDAKK